MINNAPDPHEWRGRTRTKIDLLDANRFRAMQALLNLFPEMVDGAPLPPLWHWLYFWDIEKQEDLGHDGHPRKGGFLPPVDLPRRMWASSRVHFYRPLAVGTTASCRSEIVNVTTKTGRSGSLVFVTVRHEISSDGTVCIEDEHDIVYREAGSPLDPPTPDEGAPDHAQWSRQFVSDSTLLFRYSAITFNGHRIHYDRKFCVEEERYPGLVVHGPLLATLMMEEAQKANRHRTVSSFRFRGVSPVFDSDHFMVEGRIRDEFPDTADIWVRVGRRLAMVGTVVFSG